MIQIGHNFDPAGFMWLWAKYVTGFNEAHHCTHAIRGHYSKNFNKHNPSLLASPPVMFDERPPGSFDAIYICGVSKVGYRHKQNYPHNVHAAIVPKPSVQDHWTFEGWQMTVWNGRLLPIPSVAALPVRLQRLPPDYTQCRIFRWAAMYYSDSA